MKKREIISKQKVFHFVNGGESEWLKGGEGKKEEEKLLAVGSTKNSTLSISYVYRSPFAPFPPAAFEFALALLSVINAVLTF